MRTNDFLIRFLRRLVRFCFRKVFRLLFNAFSLFNKKQEILFICNGPLMADYLGNAWELLKDDPRFRCRLCLVLGNEREEALADICAKLPIEHVKLYWAHVMKWDLIIVADHTSPDLIDQQACPAVYINHGIEGGKLVNGQLYLGGQRALNKKGEPRYSRMFVSSEAVKEQIIALNNRLRGDVVGVVGDLMTDRISEHSVRRESIREQMGFREGDKVVYVLSTWGPNCLWRTVGEKLLDQLPSLKGKYRFILGTHPNEYRPVQEGQRVWGNHLQALGQEDLSVVIVDPNARCGEYFAACDLIVTDHSSMGIYGAMMNRPLVFVPLGDALFSHKESLVLKLKSISPVLNGDVSNFEVSLDKARKHYPMEQLQKLKQEINSCPGQHNQRVKDELYRLLKVHD